MLCYKEVHKYNGRYYSRYDNGYEFKIGELAVPSGNNYIYATDTIENVLQYAYVPFDMAILEMEIPDETEWYQSGYVITSKAVKILREVEIHERNHKSRSTVDRNNDNAELFALLKQKKESVLCGM